MLSICRSPQPAFCTTQFRTYELAIAFRVDCEQFIGSTKLSASIRDQLDRASLSIALNLAEGAAKPTVKDKRKFYSTAYGSIREVQAILRIVNNHALFTKADHLGACAFKLIRVTTSCESQGGLSRQLALQLAVGMLAVCSSSGC